MVRDLSNLHIDELDDFYNNLSEVQKMIFNMSSGGASSADKVKYDNTESGLQATEVQGAIDEVNKSLSDVMNNCKLIGELTTHDQIEHELSDDVTNYKYLYLMCQATVNDKKHIKSQFIPVATLVFDSGYDISFPSDNNTSYYLNCELFFTSTTKFQIQRKRASNYTFNSLKIYGVN